MEQPKTEQKHNCECKKIKEENKKLKELVKQLEKENEELKKFIGGR